MSKDENGIEILVCPEVFNPNLPIGVAGKVHVQNKGEGRGGWRKKITHNAPRGAEAQTRDLPHARGEAQLHATGWIGLGDCATPHATCFGDSLWGGREGGEPGTYW